MNELSFVTEKSGQPVTTSRKVAEVFSKDHKDVMNTISKLIVGIGKNSDTYFIINEYRNQQNKQLYQEYLMTRDGFSLLVMGFTGKKALHWKIKYIEAFNQMESFIKSLQQAKLEFPSFTSAIMEAHEEPKHYHFSNEINMINRIVLGVTASKYKEVNGIDKKVNSIRPYLSSEQISGIEELQRIDIGLIVSGMEYEERKKLLANYFNNKKLRLAG